MSSYQVPVAKVELLSGRGFSVSIPDERGISLFAFHGKLNEPITDLSDQHWAADIVNTDANGRWTYTNRNVELYKGDVIYYWTTVRFHGVDYQRMHQEEEVP
ncbi:gram-negative bacteria-binding protein 3 [Drosophila pseudoobscura]|uniref:Gram-negative bacteria-binding protein 3 n=1 Tax=Drosophila pseudoobscura pseudoobscura TaxID=46245 RepID=A0A6I8USP2_DROPS|nr:gram-negative bacteria-binding protein 3 [Drosophila pseudoobscura]